MNITPCDPPRCMPPGAGPSNSPFKRIIGQASFWAALAAACLAPQTSRGALMAYEGFNYGTGSALTGQSGGWGWNGTWQTVNNNSSTVQGGSLVAGANAPAGYDALSTGNSAFTPNGTRTGRSLDLTSGGTFSAEGYLDGNGNIGAAGKTVYISFMQQPNAANNNYYEFEIHRGSLGDSGRIAGIGNDTGGSGDIFLRTPSAGQTLIGPGSASVSFYVVRVDFLGGNDTVYVYQNPTSATEPLTPTLLKTDAGDMSFNGLSFGAFVNGRTVAHDEVRVGESWEDVVSANVIASTGLWDGGGANNYWSMGANWDNDVVPTFATSLTFAGNTRLNPTNDLAGVSANGITFDSAASAFTLSGNSLGVNGVIRFNANPPALITQTLQLPLTSPGNISVDTRTNGNITIQGDITAPNSTLTQTSTGNVGTLLLSGTNTVAGFVVNGGTNRITGSTMVAGTGGTRFALANGNSAFSSTLIIEPGAHFAIEGNFVDAGVIGRDGGVGTVIQNGGTFSFNIGNNPRLFVCATGNANSRGTYQMNGGVLDMNGQTLAPGLGANNVVVTGIVNQVGGIITNVGQLTLGWNVGQKGRGIYRLTGGSINIGALGIQSQTGFYDLQLGGGTVSASTSWSSPLNITLTGSNGPVTFNPAGNIISLTGAISGPGGMNVSGGGILALGGANTYSGDTTIAAGTTVQLDVTGSSTGAFRLEDGAMLSLNFVGNYAIGGLYTNGVALPVGTYNAANLPGFITGSGELQVTSGISAGYWTGGGSDEHWSTAANWDNNAVPIFPHEVYFTNNVGGINTNDLVGITLTGLTFGPAAGAFMLNGNDVILNGNIGFSGEPASPVIQTVNMALTVPADQTLHVPANGHLNLGGGIFSSSGLVKTGPGALTLGGAFASFSSYIVNGGTNIITGNVNVSGNGNASRFFVGDIGATGTVVIQPGASLTVSGNFGDAGVLGRDSGSGFIIQNGGTLDYIPADRTHLFVAASSNPSTRAEYHMNGGTFQMNGYTLGVALSANASTLITGVVHQAGGTINNVGELNLGVFTFGPGRGIYRMTGGSILIGPNGIRSDSGIYEIYLGGGTVGAYSSWSSPLNMMLTGSNGPVTFDTAFNVITLSGILSGPGGLVVTGGGTLELNGANTYTGDTTVQSGTFQLNVAGSSAGEIRLAAGSFLNLNFAGAHIVGSFYTNGVALPNGNYNAANLPEFILGSGNLQVTGGVSTGLWDGGGADNYWSTSENWDNNAAPVFPIGLTFAGNARLNNTNDLPGVTATGITFHSAAGAFTLNGADLGLTGDITFSGNPPAPVTQTINPGLTATANIQLSIPSNGHLAVNGNITALNNTVYKVDAGSATLAGDNTVAGFDANGGATTITGNTLVLGTGSTRAYVANGAFIGGTVGSMIIENGATFTVDGTFADAYVIGRDSGVGTLTQNGGTFQFAIDNNPFLFVGAGNNPNTRGTYNMNGGLLDMNDNTLGIGLGAGGASVTGVVNHVSGVMTNLNRLVLGWNFGQVGRGIYRMTGGNLYIGVNGIQSQTGIYEIELGGGTVGAQASWSSVLDMTLTGNNGSVTFDTAGNTIGLFGTLTGAGGLVVTGGGVLDLSGANDYTGETVVNSGTLKLQTTNNSSSSIRLAAGTTLNLSFSGTLAVGSFYTNNVALPAGTYTAGNLPSFITGAGALQVTGSIPTSPTDITFSVSGNQLTLSWPESYLGWVLQAQTNSLGSGLGTNWVDVPGSGGDTTAIIPVSRTSPAIFYRLRYPTP